MRDLPHADRALRSEAARGARPGLRAPAVRRRTTDRGAARPRTASPARCAIRSATSGSGTPESFNGGFVIDPPDAHGKQPRVRTVRDRCRAIPRIMTIVHRRVRADRGGAHPPVGAVRDLPHAVSPKALGPGKGSASCRSRCPTRSGCTATTRKRRAASPATCRWSKQDVPDHAGLRRAARRRVAGTCSWRQLLHAADAEPLPRRSRRRGAAAGADGGGGSHRALSRIAGRADLDRRRCASRTAA